MSQAVAKKAAPDVTSTGTVSPKTPNVLQAMMQLQPKRARTYDDAGDAHQVLAEVDNWDLSVHHREATRVQNRRNVEVGSLDNQLTSHTGKNGFLYHTRLVLVGWISYWSFGDSAQVVIILVALRLL